MIPIYTNVQDILLMHRSLPLCTEDEFTTYKLNKKPVCYITASEIENDSITNVTVIDAGDHMHIAINYRPEEYPLAIAKGLKEWEVLKECME